MFQAYGINRICHVQTIIPAEHGKLVPVIMQNAKKMSDIIRQDLHLQDEEKPTEKPVVINSNPDLKKIYDVNAATLFAVKENHSYTADSKKLLYKHKSLLVAESSTPTWEESMKLHNLTHENSTPKMR